MTSAEHLQWCKDRAHRYADQFKLQEAVTSMCSDLEKHDETKFGNAIGTLMMIGDMHALSGNQTEVKRWIDGFN